MLSREVMRQIRRLQLRARRAVEDPLGGAYRSVFKGSGIAFEEVREYQPGDDIRSIDWNVTARMGQPFIKRYVEERELTVMLLLDASASMSFGTTDQTKRDVIAELGALLALCAVSNNDKVGLLITTTEVDRFIPPRKGVRHAVRLIHEVFSHQPIHAGTKLRAGFDFLNKVLHRRALIFAFSDFVDAGFEKAIQYTAQRHDMVAITVGDSGEEDLPSVGLLEVYDPELGQAVVVDTADAKVRQAFRTLRESKRSVFQQWTRGHRIDKLQVSTDGGHFDALMRFFQSRERRLKHP